MTPPLNIEKYRRHVERFQMSEDQKTELLRAVWSIMENFVDRAFGIDAAQLGGKGGNAERARSGSAVLDSEENSRSSESPRTMFRSGGRDEEI